MCHSDHDEFNYMLGSGVVSDAIGKVAYVMFYNESKKKNRKKGKIPVFPVLVLVTVAQGKSVIVYTQIFINV